MAILALKRACAHIPLILGFLTTHVKRHMTAFFWVRDVIVGRNGTRCASAKSVRGTFWRARVMAVVRKINAFSITSCVRCLLQHVTAQSNLPAEAA
jgi:hypothetical protein